jgi:dedicator of cytokinesis protein 3
MLLRPFCSYVVCTTRRQPVTWMPSADPSSSATIKLPTKSEEPQQVFIGIFPASHIHVRDELSDAEGRLPDVAAALNLGTNGTATENDTSNKDKTGANLNVPKEDDDDSDVQKKSSFTLAPPPDQANSSRAALPVYPTSLRSRSSSLVESQIIKPLPPRPSLKSGDDTACGAVQPIIDEIASALREWHTLMFQYLALRDYKLFHTVRDHIEALHLGRRQLLAQTLSAEETINLRRDCVARLVSSNITQGLDVIVRHPSWGGLVTVDVEGDIDPRSWVSAIRMYAMQSSLAYSNVPHDSANRPLALGPNTDYVSSGPSPTPTPAHSAFPETPRVKNSRSMGNLTSPSTSKATAKFYQIFLDLRAFVASPCSPGETAELFFSLYNKAEARFVTEEFCAILNHNGVLARDPSAKIRTLFTDLAQSDVQDPIYLVCRIIRNGTLKMGSNGGSAVFADGGRRGSEASIRLDSTVSDVSTLNSNYSPNTPVSPRSSFPGDSPVQFRRPFGCAVLELTQLSQMASGQADVSPLKEHAMPIFVPTNEALFSMLHQDIIANNVKEFEKSPRYVIFSGSEDVKLISCKGPRCSCCLSRYSTATQAPLSGKTRLCFRTRP